MKMLTFGATCGALLLFAAAPVSAFTDAAKKFTVDFPKGWSAPVTDTDGNTQSNAPNTDTVWCRANTHEMATLKDFTQAQLNKDYSAPLDEATWAGVLSVNAAKVKLVAHEARVVDGHVVQIATLSFTPDVVGFEATGRFASHILSGRMVNVGCFAGTKSYDGVKATFEKIVVSLKPL